MVRSFPPEQVYPFAMEGRGTGKSIHPEKEAFSRERTYHDV
ncbi:MAG: hypothetical protein RDV48_29970 [Candidatus Eremiobacteraeota bacterium]|nr:hypothetical protein [Candidatus Eremiobacteraeota bacterium]